MLGSHEFEILHSRITHHYLQYLLINVKGCDTSLYVSQVALA